MGSRRQGAAGQRMFRKRAAESGFVPLTVPGQRGTYHDFDDEIVGDGSGLLLAVEVKYRAPKRFYLKAEQIEQIEETSENFHPDTIPTVACRWKGDTTWYLHELDSFERTPSGNIPIEPHESQSLWMTFDEYCDYCRQLVTDDD